MDKALSDLPLHIETLAYVYGPSYIENSSCRRTPPLIETVFMLSLVYISTILTLYSFSDQIISV